MTDHAPLLAPHLEETQEDRLPVLLPVAEMPGATLYLGNGYNAVNFWELRSLGITHVLNLCAEERFDPREQAPLRAFD